MQSTPPCAHTHENVRPETAAARAAPGILAHAHAQPGASAHRAGEASLASGRAVSLTRAHTHATAGHTDQRTCPLRPRFLATASSRWTPGTAHRISHTHGPDHQTHSTAQRIQPRPPAASEAQPHLAGDLALAAVEVAVVNTVAILFHDALVPARAHREPRERGRGG